MQNAASQIKTVHRLILTLNTSSNLNCVSFSFREINWDLQTPLNNSQKICLDIWQQHLKDIQQEGLLLLPSPFIFFVGVKWATEMPKIIFMLFFLLNCFNSFESYKMKNTMIGFFKKRKRKGKGREYYYFSEQLEWH